MQNGIGGKRNLLVEETMRYFGEICPALAVRCEVAIVGLPPLALQEIAGRLQTLIAAADETNRQLRAAYTADAEHQASSEIFLDRALACIEHLSEIAQAMTRRMDELLKA